jgi:putative membrane protein
MHRGGASRHHSGARRIAGQEAEANIRLANGPQRNLRTQAVVSIGAFALVTQNRCRLSARRQDEAPMRTAANAVIALVALLHVYFMALEMLFWTKPLGRRAFGLSAEFAEASKRLAANQGLYNGFLAAGLIWGLWLGDAGFAIRLFFLGCVIVAGVFGALTVSRKVLWVQALPAFAAAVLSFTSR